MKTKKKFLTILLTVCLVMAMIPMTVLAADEVQDSDTWDGSVATAFAGGTGAAEDPYQISSGAELAYLASAVNSGESYGDKYFVLRYRSERIILDTNRKLFFRCFVRRFRLFYVFRKF